MQLSFPLIIGEMLANKHRFPKKHSAKWKKLSWKFKILVKKINKILILRTFVFFGWNFTVKYGQFSSWVFAFHFFLFLKQFYMLSCDMRRPNVYSWLQNRHLYLLKAPFGKFFFSLKLNYSCFPLSIFERNIRYMC